jgi:HTH-type transcriptional regulator/antitoxin HipB
MLLFSLQIKVMRQKIITASQLSHLLQSYRKNEGLTQADLGQRAGISQERYSVLESDPGRITVERLLRIVNALGLEMVLQDKGEDSARSSDTAVEW